MKLKSIFAAAVLVLSLAPIAYAADQGGGIRIPMIAIPGRHYEMGKTDPEYQKKHFKPPENPAGPTRKTETPRSPASVGASVPGGETDYLGMDDKEFDKFRAQARKKGNRRG